MTAYSSDDATAVVFDTDMATDCDDAGALAMLYSLDRRDEARIEATVVNNCGEYSAGAVAAINAYYGRSDVPLGAYQADNVGIEAAPFFEAIARDTETYGHDRVTREDVRPAVEVYRQVLAASEPGEVVLVSVGHLNNLYRLLESEPDGHSELPGRQLVEERVSQLVVMGGAFPAGAEHNFSARGAARYTGAVLDRWPTSILFSGYELGANVLTGPGLVDLPEDNPVRRAYAGHPSDPLDGGRQSWDQTAVLAAVRDPTTYWQLSEPGRVSVDEEGENEWIEDSAEDQAYLLERSDPGPDEVEAVIESLMTDLPDERATT